MTLALPIHAHEQEITTLLNEHQVLIIVGETGSGKSTFVPQLLHRLFNGLVTVTEPRRVAAVSLATFVAGQVGCGVGDRVGYRIRYRDCVSDRTAISYVTEGMLLRDILRDPMLRMHKVIVLDEVHERTWMLDVIMAHVRWLLAKRPDLQVVLMTATIRADRLSSYYDDAPVLNVEGRMFPVDVEYRSELGEDARGVVTAAIELARRTDGNVLAFVPDYAMIRDVLLRTADSPEFQSLGLDVLPLYGHQSPEEQMAAVNPTRRSLVVATNVAETSVTVQGVTGLIDTGLKKEMRYFPQSGTWSLKVIAHSKAGSQQRTGRAGRIAPGLCIRLFSQEDFEGRKPFCKPEIKRTSLTATLLQLMAMGLDRGRLDKYELLDAPRDEFWDDAEERLRSLGAVDDGGRLNEVGRWMAKMPLPPEISKMLRTALELGCVAPVATIAASMSATRPVFLRPIGQEQDADAAHNRFRNPTSDFLSVLKAVELWRGAQDRKAFADRQFLHHEALLDIEKGERQLLDILARCGIAVTAGRNPDHVACAVTAGLMGNMLTYQNGRCYRGDHCENVFIHPGSMVSQQLPKYIVAIDVTRSVSSDSISDSARLMARTVQVVTTKTRQKLGLDKDGGRPEKERAAYRKAGTRSRAAKKAAQYEAGIIAKTEAPRKKARGADGRLRGKSRDERGYGNRRYK